MMDVVANHLQEHDYAIIDSIPKNVEGESKATCRCFICNKQFSVMSNVYKHIRNVHKETLHLPTSRANLSCPICKQDNFTMMHQIHQHLETVHQIMLETERHQFKGEEEFQMWKAAVEKATDSRYVKFHGPKKLKKELKTYYYCHRSGRYRHKGANKRSMKFQGSSKINSMCPAWMSVSHKMMSGRSVYEVEYTKTHVGHTLDLDHLTLNKDDRQWLAHQLLQGIKKEEILDTVHGSVNDKIDRIHLLCRKDLLNIENTLRCKKPNFVDSPEQMEQHENVWEAEDIAFTDVTNDQTNTVMVEVIYSDAIESEPTCDDELLCRCLICDKQFSRMSNMYRHLRVVHKEASRIPITKTNILCPACSKECSNTTTLQEHIMGCHDVMLEMDRLSFSSMDAFETWRSTMESETNSRYAKQFGQKKNRNEVKTYYYCNRSGFYKSKSTGKRSLKRQGSSKINGTCPSHIVVCERKNSADQMIDVEFLKTHFGHSLDPHHINLSKDDKSWLSAQLMLGIDKQKILESVRSSPRVKDERIHLLSKKDLLNIEASLVCE